MSAMYRIADGHGTTQRNGSFLHRGTHTFDPERAFGIPDNGHSNLPFNVSVWKFHRSL
jgi:hypothetical protein